jgi:hypothetical protein
MTEVIQAIRSEGICPVLKLLHLKGCVVADDEVQLLVQSRNSVKMVEGTAEACSVLLKSVYNEGKRIVGEDADLPL